MAVSDFKFVPRVEVSLTAYFMIIFTFCVAPIFAVFLLDFSSQRAKVKDPPGCRKLGLRTTSNLQEEYNSKYAQGVSLGKDKNGRENWRVQSLWIYPIKSCRGVELHRGAMVETGLQYDRQFMLAQLASKFPLSEEDATKGEKAHRWQFLTQRQKPLMSQVRTELWVPDPSSPTYSKTGWAVQAGGVVVVTYPFVEDGWRGVLSTFTAALRGGKPEKTFRIPFSPTADQIKRNGYTLETVNIWKDHPVALNMSVHLPPELSYAINCTNPLALFRIAAGKEREVFRCAPRKDALGWQPVTGFADAHPIHIQNLASVRDVEAHQPAGSPKISVRRFRPNIILTGPPPYAEDHWKKVRMGSMTFYVTNRCVRCRLPNIDPDTAVRHDSEPDKTLRSFRCIDPGAPKNACLGMDMVAEEQRGMMTVGDAVEVLETGEHRYIGQ